MNYYQSGITNALCDFPAQKYRNIQHFSEQQIAEVQNELLKNHIHYAAENSPFYRRQFLEHGIDAGRIQTTDDLQLLPLTEKNDLLKYNEDFLAVPEEEVADVCLTSATTGGKPTMLLLTQADLARLAYNEELAFAMAGLKASDTLIVCSALERAFMAGLAYFLGGLRIGAKMVRGGSGSAAQLWQLIKVTGATAIVGVPSLMRKIAGYAFENGEDPAKSTVRKLIAIGEPVRDESLKLLPLTKKLEAIWNADLHSTYASSEMATTFCECAARQGGHLRPELIILEIVDDRGNPVKDGQKGEVVVTPLGVSGMPLVRFKTGDIAFKITGPCSCGRTTPRISPVLGRKNQMLKYKGTLLFPNTILSALEGNEHFYGGYVEVHRNDDDTDRVIFYAAVNEAKLPLQRIRDELQARLRVVPEISIISGEEVEKKTYQPDKKRKRITFFDFRE